MLCTLMLFIVMLPLSAMAQKFDETLLPSVKLPAFSALRVEGQLKVELIKVGDDEQPRIVYDLDDNDPTRFSFAVDNSGWLFIKHRPANKTIGIVKVRLYYREMTGLGLRGGDVTFVSTLEREDQTFDLSLSDGATLTGEVNCGDMLAMVYSQSNLTLSGKIQYLDIDVVSKSKVELRDATIKSAKIKSTVNSVVALMTAERMVLDVASNSVVKYWSDPKIMRSKTATLGTVVKQ